MEEGTAVTSREESWILGNEDVERRPVRRLKEYAQSRPLFLHRVHRGRSFEHRTFCCAQLLQDLWFR